MKFWINIACLFIYICTNHAQELQTVPKTLSELASKLHNDPGIQNSINRLARDGQTVARSFKEMMRSAGTEIRTEKNRLANAKNPADVPVDSLRNTLKSSIDHLMSERKDVITLQTDIHSSIETCNGRRNKHNTNMKNMKIQLEKLEKESESLDKYIKADEESIRTLEQSARDLDSQAENLRRAARKKTKRGIFGGIIGGIVGVALAPFTGGASLAISTGLAGLSMGVNLNDADDCNRKARRLRESANSKRTEAQKSRSRRDSLLVEMRTTESQTNSLKANSDELERAAKSLQEVSGFLRDSVRVIDHVLGAIEDMEAAMIDAEHESNSFEIIQNAFASHPRTFDAKSKVYLDKLKEKWMTLDLVLMQYGAKARLT